MNRFTQKDTIHGGNNVESSRSVYSLPATNAPAAQTVGAGDLSVRVLTVVIAGGLGAGIRLVP